MKNWVKHYRWFLNESVIFAGKLLWHLNLTAQGKASSLLITCVNGVNSCQTSAKHGI